MVKQVELNLSTPLKAEADPTIKPIPLEPALATAALTLHGDFYRQLQSKANHHIFWHPITQFVLTSTLCGFAYYTYSELIEISDSIPEFLFLAWNNKYLVSSFFPVIIFLIGTIGIISFLVTDEFRVVSDSLTDDATMSKIFRFPLRIYANYDENDKSQNSLAFIESASQSTELIEYRESPIAIVTVIPLPDKSTSEVFYARITGLHVRKVYAKAGLQNELMEIAKLKAKSLCSRYVADNKIKTKSMRIVLLAEGYTTDSIMTKIFKENNFKALESTTNVNPFSDKQSADTILKLIPVSFLMKIFGIYRVTYELELESTIEDVPKKNSKTTARKRKN
ncbi:putative inorganic phosphate transporter [Clavispora lusitaniae]|uniref:Inorganic phosphate transporter n=2 Tax=Clavispora lusitaniae TaxID=36911 RepID=C4Y4E8_CLAL4|nr:uncharacterized protein CLUG_02520 [Clavispora lusitaniae ATCC 42720]KAF5211375.1 hypothetical protein E0198_002682 [Clavispora lusitaniae]EEQ38394.1 hypothetical protein CLUG_02520 [Clavispora lusitaniae ATCC 42720]KAF7580210.1 Inorganic phosphate transporter Pho86 family protein [Clavispora lusitaniae]QFZ27773.1 putative inorganic phosphate transporter [Clavispora lusitaniae]QFZ32920.1 putative inorganic phosphate transporter [Clavispora lusitaniae]